MTLYFGTWIGLDGNMLEGEMDGHHSINPVFFRKPREWSQCRDHSGWGLSQWETMVQCNAPIMNPIASQITRLTIVYLTIYSGLYPRKHLNPASLAFVRRIHRLPVNSQHKGPVTWKMFPFDVVTMSGWAYTQNAPWCVNSLSLPDEHIYSMVCSASVSARQAFAHCATDWYIPTQARAVSRW